MVVRPDGHRKPGIMAAKQLSMTLMRFGDSEPDLIARVEKREKYFLCHL